MWELLARGKNTIDPEVIDPGSRSVEDSPVKNDFTFTYCHPLTKGYLYMEVKIGKFVLNCTKSFLNTFSRFFSIPLNILVMKMGLTHEKRTRFYTTFLDEFT
jgi:hypothetical protein